MRLSIILISLTNNNINIEHFTRFKKERPQYTKELVHGSEQEGFASL